MTEPEPCTAEVDGMQCSLMAGHGGLHAVGITGDLPPDISQMVAESMNQAERAKEGYEQAARQMRRATIGFLIASVGLVLVAMGQLIRMFLPY